MLWTVKPRGDGRADVLTEFGQQILDFDSEEVAWATVKRHNRHQREQEIAEHCDASRSAGA